MTRTAVILAVAGSREAGVVEACAARTELEVVRRCADLAEAVAAAQAGVGSLVLVSEHPRLTRDVVADLQSQAVTVVGLPATREAGEQLDRLGVRTVLSASASDADVAQALVDAAAVPEVPAPQVAPRARTAAVVVTVWGPTGAPGRTTLAVNLAAEAAAMGHETLLIDADTYGGAVAQACGLLDESPGIAAMARVAQHGSVRAADIDVYALPVAQRWRVLTGLSRAHRWPEVPGVAVEAMVDGAREAAQVVVIDAGFGLERDEELTYDTRAPQRHGATLAAVQAADVVIAVGTAEPLGIQRLIHGLADLADIGVRDPLVAVNRVRADVAGSRPEEAVADALVRYAGVERVWALPWDPRAADAATLAGRSLLERVPRAPLRRAIMRLAHAVVDDRIAAAAARAPGPQRSALSH